MDEHMFNSHQCTVAHAWASIAETAQATYRLRPEELEAKYRNRMPRAGRHGLHNTREDDGDTKASTMGRWQTPAICREADEEDTEGLPRLWARFLQHDQDGEHGRTKSDHRQAGGNYLPGLRERDDNGTITAEPQTATCEATK